MWPNFIITVVLALLVTGVFLWALANFPWIDADMKRAVRIIIILAVALWLISMIFGFATAPVFYKR